MNFRSFCETHQEDIDALWLDVENGVKKHSQNFTNYLILADALEEAGQDNLSKTLRWMFNNNKRPIYTALGTVRWSAWADENIYTNSIVQDRLPTSIFNKLSATVQGNGLLIRLYPSVKDAIEDLSKALS